VGDPEETTNDQALVAVGKAPIQIVAAEFNALGVGEAAAEVLEQLPIQAGPALDIPDDEDLRHLLWHGAEVHFHADALRGALTSYSQVVHLAVGAQV